ncbi:MAG: endolytic transglycosylase MltG [Chloroflexi bacterium]|jgi:UPF0755 protein|nr:endolytic transglycosylase MltG [Chloroflexota bacterium]
MGDGGGTGGGGGRRYAPSQSELRDPVARARAARRLRDGGPRRRDRAGRGIGVIAGLGVVAAVFVLVGGFIFMTVLRPAAAGFVTGMAYDSPSLLGIGWIADLVAEDLGPSLTQPAGTDTKDVAFTVNSGDTAATIAARLADAGLLADPRAFVYLALQKDLSTQFQAGDFTLRSTMTPEQIASALTAPAPTIPTGIVSVRTGLRLEQIAALLEAQRDATAGTRLSIAAKDFLDVTRKPSAALLADYPWLELPKGATLEGFLAAGDYQLPLDATAEDLVRAMLDRFYAEVGVDRMAVPKERGLSFYEVLTLASIVEIEAKYPEEKAKIAGVLQNRLTKTKAETAGFLGSDVTTIYALDTQKLSKLALAKWPGYVFWQPLEAHAATKLSAANAAYDTYTTKGLPPGPIDTPTLTSIDAALTPDTKGGYLYFLAKKDGTTVFAKTYAEHQKNIAKYMQ